MENGLIQDPLSAISSPWTVLQALIGWSKDTTVVAGEHA